MLKSSLKLNDRVGTITMTFYYKDDVLLKQESVRKYTCQRIDADNPLDHKNSSSRKTDKNTKILSSKRF